MERRMNRHMTMTDHKNPYAMFWSSLSGVFSRYSGFLPSFIDLTVQQYKNKAQTNAISTLSNLITELSLCTTWHITQYVACDKRSMCCTWFTHNCARATWAYELETVRGVVRRLHKISNCTFGYDYYYHYHYLYYYYVTWIKKATTTSRL